MKYYLTESQVAILRNMINWWRMRPIDLRRGRAKSRTVAPKVKLYKAIADASGGTVQVKAVNADGTTKGDAITLVVVP